MSDRSGEIGVLVVDDSDEFLAAVRSWITTQPGLRLAGTARNGIEALEALQRSSPDLILMDAFMPVLDGFQATRRIKTGARPPLVVILSVHEGSAVENEAWAAGADGFVPKAEFAVRLPGVIRALISGDVGRPGALPSQRPRPEEKAGPAAHHGGSREVTPEGPAERAGEGPGGLSLFWRGVRARIRSWGIDRRPEVVSASSLSEGGIS